MVEQRGVGSDTLWDRVATWMGAAFAVLAFVAFLLTGRPEEAASGEDVVEFFADKQTAIEWQAVLFGLAALAFLWFAGRLAALLRGAAVDPGDRIPTITVAGAASSTALFLVGVGAFAALAQHADEAGATRALFDLGDMSFALSTFTAAVFLEGAAVGIMRTRILPRWMGLAGAVLVTALLIAGSWRMFDASDAAAAVGSIVFVAFLVWVLAASVLLSMRERPAR